MAGVTLVHPVLETAAAAAVDAYRIAVATRPRSDLAATVGLGGDGTPTYALDVIVERPVLDVLERHGVNVLSEEVGWIDRGSAMTVVMDPVDGTANAVAGVPWCAFGAALAVDGELTEALVVWLDGGRRWAARCGVSSGRRTTGRRSLDGAAVCMLRPRPATMSAWSAVAARADRVRVLGSSLLEGCLVADGAVDAFCDPGGDVHRIVDLAATQVIVEAAGGVVADVHGRPLTLEPDLRRRWSGIVAATPDLAAEIADIVRRHPAPDTSSSPTGHPVALKGS